MPKSAIDPMHRQYLILKSAIARKTVSVLIGINLLVAVLSSSFAPAILAAERPASGLKPNTPQQYSLQNGLRIILVEDHSLPVISSMVWYKVGARNEAPGSTGLSHIVEHLLFQTVGHFRKGELGATIVRNGGQFNGFTSDDFTAFYETLPPSKMDLALKIESERMRSATFTQADLSEEIGRVKTELDESAKDPSNNLAREVRAAAFIQHPYRNPTVGWRQDLESINVKEVKEFYERFFRPNNATLVLVGDFKSQPTLAAIGKLFGTIPKSPAPIPVVRITESAQAAERRIILKAAAKKDEVQIAYHAPAFSDPDSVALYVLEKLLNASISGRIKTRLLDPKLCGYGRSAFEIKKDPGLFSITLTAPSGTGTTKILDGWDNLVAQLRSTPISDAELIRARNQAEFSVIADRDGAYRTGFQLGYCETMQSWQKGWTAVDRLKEVTSADILRVSKRYLNPENRVVGFLYNPSAKPYAAPGTATPPKSTPPTKPAPNAINLAPKLPISFKPVSTRSTHFGTENIWAYKKDENAFVWPAALTAKQKLLVAESIDSSSQSTSPRTPDTDSRSSSTTSSTSLSTPSSTSPSTRLSPSVTPTSGGTGTSALTAPRTPAATGTRVNSGAATGVKAGELKTGAAAEKERAVPVLPLVQKKTLKNGVTVLVVESHLAPIVQISGAIKAGDVFEATGKKGVSALLVQLLNDGPTKSSRQAIQLQQEDMGLTLPAMLKFDNSIETINFQSRCLSRDFMKEMTLIGSCLKGLSFEDADCEKAKNDFFNSAKSTEDTTPVRVNRALLRSVMAPGSTYYPSDPKEKVHAASTLKASDIKEFAGQHMTPDATVIVVAGDITPDAAYSQIEHALDGWSNGSSKHGNLPQATENARKILKVSLPDPDYKGKTLLTMGRLMKSQSEKKDYAAILISDCALTNHPIFSRLAQRISTDPSLANNLVFEDMESRYVPLSNMVTWSMTVPVDPRLLQMTSFAIQNELKRFTKSGITAEELAEIKRYLAAALPVRMMPSSAEAANHVLIEYLQDSESNIPWQLISRIRATDLTTINNFIKNEFKPDQSVLIIAGPGSSTVATAKSSSAASAAEKISAPTEEESTETNANKND